MYVLEHTTIHEIFRKLSRPTLHKGEDMSRDRKKTRPTLFEQKGIESKIFLLRCLYMYLLPFVRKN